MLRHICSLASDSAFQPFEVWPASRMMRAWYRGNPSALLHHSDQGRQYTCEHFQQLLKEEGITCSMSWAGEVWDNSSMGSSFRSLPT